MFRKLRHRDRAKQGRTLNVLIAGFGPRTGGDEAAALVAADRMAEENWPQGVEVVDLGEDTHAAATRIARSRPPYDRLVLLTSNRRGSRAPGRIYSYRWARGSSESSDHAAQNEHATAADADVLLARAQELGALPAEVVVIEFEAEDAEPGTGLSDRALRMLPELMRRAQREALAPAKRAPETQRTGAV